MGKIIVHHTHHEDETYDASTPEAEEKAWRAIFASNKEMTCYESLSGKSFEGERSELEDEIQSIETLDIAILPKFLKPHAEKAFKTLDVLRENLKDMITEAALYEKAVEGDLDSIKKLLRHRKTADSEGYTIKESK